MRRDGFTCHNCGHRIHRIVDSRFTRLSGNECIRRRRKCGRCGHKWTTYEVNRETEDARRAAYNANPEENPVLNKLHELPYDKRRTLLTVLDALHGSDDDGNEDEP